MKVIPKNNQMRNDTNFTKKPENPSISSGGTNFGKNEGVGFAHSKTPESGTKTNDTKKTGTKNIHALDVYIIFCFISIIIYTVVHTLIFYKLGIEATVLDALFYGVFGGEVLLCALLKRLKLKQEFESTLKKTNKDDENGFVE